MNELEGPREIRKTAEVSHGIIRGYMTKRRIIEPPMIFFTKMGIVVPDRKDLEDAPRIFQRFLELTGECFAKTFLARLRNEDGIVVHEDALVTVASDGGDLTYHLADPFTYERREGRVVEIKWDEDCGSWSGWQSRSANRDHVRTLSLRQQRMLDYISAESNMEWKNGDWLRMLGMRIVPWPIEEVPTEGTPKD